MNNFFNPDAEIGLLSILLKSPESWFSLSNIKSFMFSSTPNKFLFETFSELTRQSLVPNKHLLENYLKTENKLELAGGQDYLNYLSTLDTKESNIRVYERIILDNYKSRTLLALASEVSNKLDSPSNVDAVIGSVRTSLDNLTDVSGGNDTVHVAEIADDSLNEIKERRLNPGIIGITTGFFDLDYITGGFNPADFWYIVGRPGMAKSALMCNMVLAGAEIGVPSLIMSMEMSRNQLIERMLAVKTGIELTSIRMGTISDKEFKLISETLDNFKKLPIYIDNNYQADADYLETTVRRYAKMFDIRTFYLDNINLMVERNTESTHELGKVSRRGKLLAGELNITTIFLAQLNRGVEVRDDKRPRLSDIRQSGNMEEDGDIVCGLYRDDYYNPNSDRKGILENIILKHRNGPTGTIMLKFQESTTKVSDK